MAQQVQYYDPKEALDGGTGKEAMLSTDTKQSLFTLEDAGLDEETIAWAEDNQRKQEKMHELWISLITMTE